MLSVPAPTRVALGTLEVGGQKVELFLSPEWARYFQSLNTQVMESTVLIAAAANLALASMDDGAPENLQMAPGFDFSNGAYPGSFTDLTYSGALTGGTGVIKIGGTQIYKDALGKVGIGIVPTASLEVFSTAAEYAVKWSMTGANKWTLGSYVGGAYLANFSTGAKHVQFTDAGLTQICGGGSPAIYVDGVQHVGIGVPAPGYALDVAGITNSSGGYSIAGTAGATGTVTGAGGLSITYAGGLVTAASSGVAGITGTLTTASLVGKTLTFTNGIITAFA